jgi:hypothetical protein
MKNEIEEKKERLIENEKVFDLFSYFFKKMQGYYYSYYSNNNNINNKDKDKDWPNNLNER